MTKRNKTYESLQKEIQQKATELEALKAELATLPPPSNTNETLENYETIYQKVKAFFTGHFSTINTNAEEGKFTINDERYILIRSSSMSYDFFKTIYKLYKNESQEHAFQLTSDLLYDVARLIGKEDASRFLAKMNLKKDVDKLVVGPIHFAFTGWAKVELLEDTNLTAGDQFFVHFRHHNSFEADAWINHNETAEQGVCVMSAGYSSGWIESCFNTPMTTIEISCRAAGDEYCEFIMAPPHRIQNYIDEKTALKYSKVLKKQPIYMEHQLLKQKLYEREKMLQDAQRIAKLGSWYYDLNAKILNWSNELFSIFEVSHKTVNLKEDYLDLLHKNDRDELKKHIKNTLNNKEGFEFKHTIKTKKGKIKWLDCIALPVFNAKKKLIGLEGIVQDVSEKIIQGRELNTFFDLSVDLQCVASTDGYFIKISPSWSKLLGYTNEELTSKPFISFVHPDDEEITTKEVESLMRTNHTFNFENRYIKKDGGVAYLNWNSTYDHATNLIYCTARDVTADVRIKRELQQNVKDKEMLLKEVHHRVKNNLQIISSLLSLQSNLKAVNNPHLQKLYEDSQNRIKSMAAIHELFYKSDNQNSVNFKDYLEKLIIDLVYSISGSRENIELEQEIESIHLNLDTAVPLGLVINEIITNSIKHALPESGKGHISIKLKSKNNTLELFLSDKGKGIKSPIEKNKIKTLGMTIIRSLIEQLNGSIELVTNGKGTRYKIIIPLTDEKNNNL